MQQGNSLDTKALEKTVLVTPRRGLFHLSRRTRMAYLMVLPAILLIAGIVFYPVGTAFWYSLHDIELDLPQIGQPWVGLDNYVAIFSDGRIWDALKFTTAFAFVSVALEFGLGLGIAVVMNRAFRGRGVVRALVLIPWALTTVVSARMWALIYNNEYGVLNEILRSVGLIKQNVNWTSDQDIAFWALIGAEVWKSTPFVALILLAGLQLIPADIYEAARVDGASSFRSFLYITLPALRPTMLVALLFRTIDAARVFDLIYVLTGGGPGTATESLNIYTYKTLFSSHDFGKGSALAMITFGYIMIIALLYIRVLNGRKNGD